MRIQDSSRASRAGAMLVSGMLVAMLASSGLAAQDGAAREPAALRAAPGTTSPSLSWESAVTGPDHGRVRFTLEQIGPPDSPLDPSWPVMARWTYDAPDSSKSYTAQLFGHGDFDGTMVLYGVVSHGYRAGQPVRVTVHGGKRVSAVLSFGDDRAS